MNLNVYKFKITGIFALLTNNPAKMAVGSNEVKRKRIPSPEEEAEAGLYVVDGGFGFPSIGFRSSLLNGLKNKKVGRASAISIFQAAVFNVDEMCLLHEPNTEQPLIEYTIDTRRAVIQRNGVMRSRPRFDKWGCFLNLQIDEDIVTPEQVEENLNISGQIVGVGDYRIEKRGPFGKYKAELIGKIE